MKRFLKHDRYQLDDLEKEKIWHGIRRNLQNGDRSSFFRTVNLRPTLVATATMAALVVLGVWWIDGNQADKIQANHPGLLAEGPAEVTRQAVAPVEETAHRNEAKSSARTEIAAISEMDKAPRGALDDEGKEETRTFEVAVTNPAPPAPAADMAVEKSSVRAVVQSGAALTGRVVDQETGQGLANARVFVRGTTRSVSADSSGVFVLDGLPAGQAIALMIMRAGYDPLEIVVNVPQRESFEYAFNLDPETVDEEVKVAVLDSRREITDASPQFPVGMTPLNEKDEAVRFGGVKALSRGPSPSEEALRQAPRTPDGTWGMGSVTGGTRPPNDEQVELMYFEHTGVNPFVATEDDSLSTFAVDVDNASWTVARNYLSRGMLPPKDAIRVEEFINTFDPGWERHTDDVFRLHTDGAVSRFGDGYHLLRIGVVGKTVKDENRKAANLIFVIDISGSMNRENRLGAVKKSLHILLNELGEGDRVGLVVYGSQGEVRLEPTDISRREVIMQAIDGLATNGSTNVYEGLELAYGLARKYYEPAKVNRLILCSDGVANNGASTEAEKILSLVRKASDEGITISSIGFGMGNYNDVLMEKLANKGDGNYYYVDRQEEAERVFKENLTGLLQTIAREVKVQVEFDADVVTRWRLLGYENRDVADRDFRNDAVDAGEVGAGHQVTALYELKLAHPPGGTGGSAVDEAVREGPAIRVGTVRLRHEAPAHDTARAGEVEEIEQTILLSQLANDFASGTVWMRVQTVAAEFAEILRGSYWAKESRLIDLIPVADGLAAEMPGDPLVRDLADMIRKAADLQATDTPTADPQEKEE